MINKRRNLRKHLALNDDDELEEETLGTKSEE